MKENEHSVQKEHEICLSSHLFYRKSIYNLNHPEIRGYFKISSSRTHKNVAKKEEWKETKRTIANTIISL